MTRGRSFALRVRGPRLFMTGRRGEPHRIPAYNLVVGQFEKLQSLGGLD